MIATIVISAITFILITLSILFFPKIRVGKITLSTYWIIALIGASILLIFQFASFADFFQNLTSDKSINPLKILALFFSMTILSIFLDEVGLFHYLAHLATKRAKNNQFLLFLIFYLLTAVLTIFTSNDIVILTFTPFICFFCKSSKINPIPYLVAEFAAANTWSLMLIIGNPTNIYLATSSEITFFEYFKVMALPTLCGGLVELGLLLLIFHKKLKSPLTIVDDQYHIKNKVALVIGLVHLFTCLIFLIISNHINVEMWIISTICAGSLLICVLIMCLINKKDFHYLTGSLKKLPYPLIPFFLSMVVIVVSFNSQGISAKITELLSNSSPIWTYGFASFIASNLINNIPMSILFSNIVTSKSAIYASIVGSNIGAFLTPTGALAGIMFTKLINDHHTKYSFLDFVKYGVITSIPVISVILLILSFML